MLYFQRTDSQSSVLQVLEQVRAGHMLSLRCGSFVRGAAAARIEDGLEFGPSNIEMCETIYDKYCQLRK